MNKGIEDGKVIIRRSALWLAWYPARRRRSQVRVDSMRGYFEVAVGPLYLCLGHGRPEA